MISSCSGIFWRITPRPSMKVRTSASVSAPAPGRRTDAGADALAARRIGHADHGDVGDLRVRRQLVLDALGGEVLALADDDVLAPAGDAQIAVGVDHGEVAGAEEAVGA